MTNKVISYVKQNNMLKENDKVVVGVSGGADSVCLFFLLLEMQPVFHLQIHVVHIHHGIRGEEADRDESFVAQLSKQAGIPFNSYRRDVKTIAFEKGLSEEEAGRMVRYDAFREVLERENCHKIAVAHNENDQAETILFHLCRGTGLQGLAGISPVRGQIIRPLLSCSRIQIEQYLKKRGISFRNDATNLEDVYTRNKIRHHIIPFLSQEINAGTVSHIASMAGQLRQVQTFLDKMTDSCFEKMVTIEDGVYSYEVEAFQKEDIVMQKAVIRKIFFMLSDSLKDIEMIHVEQVQTLVEKSVGKEIQLPYEIYAIREYYKIRIRKQEKNMNLEHLNYNIREVKVSVPADILFQGELYLANQIGSIKQVEFEFRLLDYIGSPEIPKKNCTKWFDYDKIENAIFIRGPKTGDYIQVNEGGSRKKLNRYFIDKKIPKEKRNHHIVLADDKHIIWIVGDRISEAYKVDIQTKRVLQVTIHWERMGEQFHEQQDTCDDFKGRSGEKD